MKGLICAGGSATRLEELTRVTNKHLLPVGRWPMVYYPLQLLQRVGVRDVLIVTGQQHAGDFIDLLGDGRVRSRSGDELLFDLDLSYKVQVEPGGIAQVVGMARDFAAGDQLVVCLGDNIFEHAQADSIRSWRDGALVFVKEVSDPQSFGVVAYDGDGRVADIVEKAGVVDTRFDTPPVDEMITTISTCGCRTSTSMWWMVVLLIGGAETSASRSVTCERVSVVTRMASSTSRRTSSSRSSPGRTAGRRRST